MRYQTIVLLILLVITTAVGVYIWWGMYTASKSDFTSDIEMVEGTNEDSESLPPPLTEEQIEQSKESMNEIPPLTEEQVLEFQQRYQN